MPVPDTHYRVALGEYRRRHSWIVQSNKGLIWVNVHDDLSSLLNSLRNTVPPSNVLDFSLGSAGRYYIRYSVGGQERRKLSRGLWEEINQNPNLELDRLTLGPDGQHWGVRVDRDGRCRSFDQVDDSGAFGYRLDTKIDRVDSFDEIEFVALGAGGDWAFGVNGRVEHRGSKLFRNCISEGRRSGKTILSAAMSPLDRCWFLCWDDGMINFYLPGDMTDAVDDYCQLQHSMMGGYFAKPRFGEIRLPMGDVPTDPECRAKHWRASVRRKLTIVAAIAIVVLIVIAIVIAIVNTVVAIKRHQS